METKQGIITKKTLKYTENNETKYAVYEFDKRRYNTFDKELVEEFKEGDKVEYDLEQKGKYTNLISMKKLDQSPTSHVTEDKPPKELASELALDGFIIRSKALLATIEILGNSGEQKTFWEQVKRFENYIWTGEIET